MFDIKPAFVFVHGAWQAAAVWRKLMPLLEARGHAVRALDLPGAGAHARHPVSFDRRPLDTHAFASEASPNAATTQDDRTRAVIDLVESTRKHTGAPVALVGHSVGGLTVTAVAEAIPQRLHAAVYLCAYMVAPGMSALALRQHPVMHGSLIPTLQKANPRQTGALRIDPRSDDPAYREQMRLAFCGDMSADDLAREIVHMHSDEAAGPLLLPSPMTAERFSRVPRHYVRTLDDRAIPAAAQDFMIAGVDGAMGNRTHTHTLAAAHMPQLSRPEALAGVLSAIAA